MILNESKLHAFLCNIGMRRDRIKNPAGHKAAGRSNKMSRNGDEVWPRSGARRGTPTP